MKTVANVIVALVALIHIYIVYLEMFLWTTPKGQKAFGITADFAQQSKALAANQGLSGVPQRPDVEASVLAAVAGDGGGEMGHGRPRQEGGQSDEGEQG